MHRFNLSVRYAVLTKSSALYPECVHNRLNWAEKGVLSVAAYGGHGRVMRSDKAAFSVTLGTIFWESMCEKIS